MTELRIIDANRKKIMPIRKRHLARIPVYWKISVKNRKGTDKEMYKKMHISAALIALVAAVIVALPVRAVDPVMPGAGGSGESGIISGNGGANGYGGMDDIGPDVGKNIPRGVDEPGNTKDIIDGTTMDIPDTTKTTDKDPTSGAKTTDMTKTSGATKTTDKPGAPSTKGNGMVDPDDSESTNKSVWAVIWWIIAAIAIIVIVWAIIVMMRKRRHD